MVPSLKATNDRHLVTASGQGRSAIAAGVFQPALKLVGAPAAPNHQPTCGRISTSAPTTCGDIYWIEEFRSDLRESMSRSSGFEQWHVRPPPSFIQLSVETAGLIGNAPPSWNPGRDEAIYTHASSIDEQERPEDKAVDDCGTDVGGRARHIGPTESFGHRPDEQPVCDSDRIGELPRKSGNQGEREVGLGSCGKHRKDWGAAADGELPESEPPAQETGLALGHTRNDLAEVCLEGRLPLEGSVDGPDQPKRDPQ